MSPSAEPIIAWRKWRTQASDFTLRSLYKDVVWPPQERLEASCIPRGGDLITTNRACVLAPSFKCHCGIHGVESRHEVHRFGTAERRIRPGTALPILPSLTVVGRVSLWGHWIEHESGWRAQYAYPFDLHVLRPSLGLEGIELAQAAAAALRATYLVDADWE